MKPTEFTTREQFIQAAEVEIKQAVESGDYSAISQLLYATPILTLSRMLDPDADYPEDKA